jgi:hypothetical protein
MKKKGKLLAAIFILIIAAVYYYVELPAISIHSVDFWKSLMLLVAVIGVVYIGRRKLKKGEIRQSKGARAIIGVFLILVVVFGVGALLSSPIINAKKYQQLLSVEEGDFATDVEEVSFDQIPLMDKETAELLGDRKMGSMVDMVSQFEVSDLYTQINYQERPVRVSPLRYANIIKWFTNRSTGIPAYVTIDMASQNTELVKLDEGIKYSTSEYFNRNIYRHLRFSYPTYIFDDVSFELDDDGTPYWVCPVKQFNIGLFGGVTIGRTVLCNAITGEMTDYKIEDVPEWVDHASSADLLVELFDYYGTLKHGFINSVLSQKDCLQTTSGYNYLAIDDDVWVYTGVTSVNSDQSNVGFVLMNQRTNEAKYYTVEGATERSAMSSAEGQVQNLGYEAAFPLLLNISDQPTYFIALKDDAGLVKKYAMVNVQKYQMVAIGDTVAGCKTAYNELLDENGISVTSEDETADTVGSGTITGTIAKIAQSVVDGNSHYYIMLEDSDQIFDISVVDFLEIITYNVGDKITLEYQEGEKANTVVGLQ